MTPEERVIKFIGKLKHTGDYAGRQFVLRPWQEDPIRRLFGTLREDGTRQYRKCFWAMPRKTGKTELIAACGLYLAMGQGKRNQKGYCASGDFKQASLIFSAMADMLRQDPVLERSVVIYDGAKKILFPKNNSSLEVLSSVPKSKHGLSPTFVLVDEMHVCDENLLNVLTTAFGARKEPLVIYITTAGEDQNSLCYDEWQYALQVRDGIIQDDTYLSVIYAADPEDDWTDEATWHKANPALGDFCNLTFLREEFQKALKRPRYVNVFKQLYLNLWVSSSSSWLSIEEWDQCGTLTQEDVDALDGQPCYAGLDLGVVGDLSAAVFLYPNHLDGLDLLCKFWCPKDGKWKEEPHNKIPYTNWAEDGSLTLTEGTTTDHNVIEEELVEWNEWSPIKLLTADRAYATQLLNRLFNHHELPVKGIAQGPITLNAPMVKFEEMVTNHTLRHGRNPVMRYCVANGKVKKGPTGLMFLDKSSTSKRIDGLSAAVDAVAGYIANNPADEAPSVYEKRGLLRV